MRSPRLVSLLLASTLAVPPTAGAQAWQGAWGFPPISYPPADARNPPPAVVDFDTTTVRQIVRLSGASDKIRIRLSNEFGTAELRIDHVHVALADADGATRPGTDHALTFNGQTAASVAAGAPLLSDPLDWSVPALSRLAVSIYLTAPALPPAHRVSLYVSERGDFGGALHLPGAQLLRTGALVSGVEVESRHGRGAIVAFGDSITEGHGSTVNEFRTWPDRLAERLQADVRTRDFTVVNAGINSNRLLHNNPGMGGLARFDRDVLAVPGVRLVVLLEGINDIGYSHTVPQEAVSAAEIIGAYRQLIARAHAHGLGIIGGTLTPFEDAHYYSPEGEALRSAVNTWIRTSGAFDAIIDFDAVLRDASHPTRVNAALTLTDHLHPNDAGYEAMARAIDLKMLARALTLRPLSH